MKGCFILEWTNFLFSRSGEGGIVYKSLQSCSAEWRHAGLGMQQKLGEWPPTGPGSVLLGFRKAQTRPCPSRSPQPPGDTRQGLLCGQRMAGTDPRSPVVQGVHQSHSRAGAGARRGHGQPMCAWRVREGFSEEGACLNLSGV